MRKRSQQEGGDSHDNAVEMERRSSIAASVTCGICGCLVANATAISECLHAFCRECIVYEITHKNINHCPKCGIDLGGHPLAKLRPDHSLERIRSLIFTTKRHEVVTVKKMKERVSSESTLPSVVGIIAEGSTPLTPTASESKAQKDLVLVRRDALSRVRGQDFDSACGLTEETGALIVWQAPPILEEMADPESFRLPATSDIEYKQQGPTAQTTNISFMFGSSSCATPSVQDDEKLWGDFHKSITRIQENHGAQISKLKTDNAKLTKKLENERAAALERTKIIERLQKELEDEREAAERSSRLLEEKHKRELEHEREVAIEKTSRNKALEEEISKLHEELRADNQDILEKTEEIATLKYYSSKLESEKTYLENQVDDLDKELEYIKKEHQRIVNKVLDAVRVDHL